MKGDEYGSNSALDMADCSKRVCCGCGSVDKNKYLLGQKMDETKGRLGKGP